MSESKAVPSVTIHNWPEMYISPAEIKNILTFLAYKTGKFVTFGSFITDEGYSENYVNVRIALADGIYKTSGLSAVKLNQKSYILAENQVKVHLNLDIPQEKQILDDDSLAIAYVDHNRIIIPIEITATDNEAARALLSYIVEHSIELLDFKITEKILEQRKLLAKRFWKTFANRINNQIYDKEQDLKNKELAAQTAYYTIIEYEQRKPIIEKEINYLKRLQCIKRPRLFYKQTQALIELLASGQYSNIEPGEDSSISATTSPITIEYNDWRFPIGRYEINIDTKGDITIEALDEHPNADHPHPHIGTDGRPCLGNVAGDIPKMIGSMRIAEALQVLYEFLCEYHPDNPFEKISHFDATGQYYDEDDSPCENCDESCSPYCINQCSDNTGQYTCSDCDDYRNEYCYLDCDYNRDFEQFSPCDDCGRKGEEYCYLDCQYNKEWQLQKPCEENCEFEECDSECPYFEKLQALKEITENADSK